MAYPSVATSAGVTVAAVICCYRRLRSGVAAIVGSMTAADVFWFDSFMTMNAKDFLVLYAVTGCSLLLIASAITIIGRCHYNRPILPVVYA